MPPPSLNAATRRLLSFIAKTQEDDRRAYIGDTEVGALLVRNDDGTVSKVGNARAEDILIAGIQSVSGQVSKVTILQNEPPDANAKWWLSSDRGVTKDRAKKVSITGRDGFYTVLLEKS